MSESAELLIGPRGGPARGEADRLIVFVHGYGADGQDLFSLSQPLSRIMPSAAFAAPNGPERSKLNPMGYQWFPIPWIDGSSEEEMIRGFTAASKRLGAYLDAELARYGLSDDRLALVGFSQGSMMSLEVGPKRAADIAGIVAFSGQLANPAGLKQARRRPPILLAHGEEDDVIPVAALDSTRDALVAEGFNVSWRRFEGLGHGISPDGLELAAHFLLRVFDGGDADTSNKG